MLRDSDSTEKHLNKAKRHVRMCRQNTKTASFADAITPVYELLKTKADITTQKKEEKQYALDDVVLADNNLDDEVRSLFDDAKKYDRTNSGNVLATIFTDGKTTTITDAPRIKELQLVDQLCARIESFGQEHDVYPYIATLKEKSQIEKDAIKAYENKVTEQKMAEVQEELAQATLRKAYEDNYLDLRKAFGKRYADKLFPKS